MIKPDKSTFLLKSTYKITNLCYFSLALIISTIVIAYPPNNTFCYDVFGYYMYLPLGFKYHDIAIQNYSTITELLNTYHASETFYQAIKWDNNNWVMRYPIGLSVLFSPFYFIADGITRFTNYPADGFSRPYQLSVLYGCLFYTLAGLYFIKKILTTFFDDKTSAITLICITLGTNYFFHVSLHGHGAMSHNIVFTLYAIIIYLTIKWHHSYNRKHILLLGVFIGLNALCRASEIISVLIPLFYGVINWKSFKEKISLLYSYRTQIILFSLIIIGIGFIQFGYWKFVSGRFIINPYGSGNPGEGFELFHPHLLKVLFSFRKGWFIYTPIMLFTMIGFKHLYKNNRALFTPVFIYFIINLYIVSSWSCWWYGACFGVRALIPSYAVLSIPFAYFIYYALRSKLKILYMIIAFLLVSLNLFQTWQMSAAIIHPSDMSRPYYFSTFLQTSPPTPQQRKLLLKGKFNDGIEIFTKEDSLTHSLNYLKAIDFEEGSETINTKYLCDSIKHHGKYSLSISANSDTCYLIEVPHKDMTKKSYTWIKSTVWVYSPYPADSLKAVFGIQMKHKGYIFKQKLYPLNSGNFKPNVWNKIEHYYLTPDDLRNTKDLISTYILNTSKRPVYIDNFILQSYEPIVDKSVF